MYDENDPILRHYRDQMRLFYQRDQTSPDPVRKISFGHVGFPQAPSTGPYQIFFGLHGRSKLDLGRQVPYMVSMDFGHPIAVEVFSIKHLHRQRRLLALAINGAIGMAESFGPIQTAARALARHFEEETYSVEQMLGRIRNDAEQLHTELTPPPSVFKLTQANQPTSKRGRRFQQPDPGSRQAKYSTKRKR